MITCWEDMATIFLHYIFFHIRFLLLSCCVHLCDIVAGVSEANILKPQAKKKKLTLSAYQDIATGYEWKCALSILEELILSAWDWSFRGNKPLWWTGKLFSGGKKKHIIFESILLEQGFLGKCNIHSLWDNYTNSLLLTFMIANKAFYLLYHKDAYFLPCHHSASQWTDPGPDLKKRKKGRGKKKQMQIRRQI